MKYWFLLFFVIALTGCHYEQPCYEYKEEDICVEPLYETVPCHDIVLHTPYTSAGFGVDMTKVCMGVNSATKIINDSDEQWVEYVPKTTGETQQVRVGCNKTETRWRCVR